MSLFSPKSSGKIAKQGLDEQIIRAQTDLANTCKELATIDIDIDSIVSRNYEEEIIHLTKTKEFLEQNLQERPGEKDLITQIKNTKKEIQHLEIEADEAEPKLHQLEKKRSKIEDKKESLERELSTLIIKPQQSRK